MSKISLLPNYISVTHIFNLSAQKNLSYWQWYTRRTVESVQCRAFTVLIILIDFILFFVAMSEVDWKFTSTSKENNALVIVNILIIIYFIIEVGARIFGQGPKVFFSSKIEVFDFSIVVSFTAIGCIT